MIALRRIAEHFVRSGPTGAEAAGDPLQLEPAASRPNVSPSVALVASAADGPALGAALGLALARSRSTPAALVCVWSVQPARPSWRAPALPGAGRLAAALAARGHDARASGRLVVVRLATACDQAAAEALRASAAAGAAPTVLTLAGPRHAIFDAVLAQQDLVVVAVPAASDPALARLAVASLERAITWRVPPADAGRALAAAGIGLLPSARRVLAEPMAVLS